MIFLHYFLLINFFQSLFLKSYTEAAGNISYLYVWIFSQTLYTFKKTGEQWITAQGIVAVTLTSTYIYVFSNIEWPCISRYFLHFFVVLYYVKIHYLQYWWTALSLLHFKIMLMYSSISFFQVFKTLWKNMTLRVESFTSTE